jgi:hypothetical protein
VSNSELEDFVVLELARHGNRNDLITRLCEQYGMRWEEAEAFIKRVETHREGEIQSRQTRNLRVIGWGIILAGVGLSVGMVITVVGGISIQFLFLPIPFIINFVLFGVGLLMVLGSAMGMRRLD